jgi:alkaline phosphatase D
MNLLYRYLWLTFLFCCTPEAKQDFSTNNNLTTLSGGITATSIILQSRFTNIDTLVNQDIPGVAGTGCFQVSTDSNFTNLNQSSWLQASSKNDFIIKNFFNFLDPDTQYYYRVKALIYNTIDTVYSSISQFETLPTPGMERPISFAISTGFNYEKFYGIDQGVGSQSKGVPAIGKDRILGFEAFEAVNSLDPDFFIANGDVVYYDKPGNQPEIWARDLISMRAKWHRYFAMPRNRELCATTPVYYLKDDHDYRFNDCDTTNVKFSDPSHELGIQVFKEQLPVTDPQNRRAKTYRTMKAGKLLQLWFLEGRDYRSPNDSEDTVGKSIWGQEQKEWLKTTLMQSQATFKILISPTPLVGPDDAYKKDNHTNEGGFRSEQQEFFKWLSDNNFLNQNLYIICGDRHWQYHSIHPNGLEEFSSGAFVDQNSRPGRPPGDPKSTDPEATITSPFMQHDQWGGGFLFVTATLESDQPVLNISFRDTEGKERYASKKPAL